MTKGLDDILKNLTKLQVQAPKVARSAVTEVAEEFEKQLIVNTPIDDIGETLLVKTLQFLDLKEHRKG